MKPKLAMALVLVAATTFSFADDRKVEAYARAAAEAGDKSLKQNQPNDGVTKSQRAFSQGKAVIYEYVLAIRADVTEQQLAAWRSATRSEVVPPACTLLKRDEFFKQGFHFRYRYLDRSGRVLDDFSVNKPACEGL